MKTIFYKKEGRKYIPVSEYDTDFCPSIAYGDWLLSVYPAGSSRRRIDPSFAPMIAAGRYAEDAICAAIRMATEIKPTTAPLTQEQRDAWDNLSAAFGETTYRLQWQSSQDVARAAIAAMQEEADRMLKNPALKIAYDEFMIIWKLTKETQNDNHS